MIRSVATVLAIASLTTLLSACAAPNNPPIISISDRQQTAKIAAAAKDARELAERKAREKSARQKRIAEGFHYFTFVQADNYGYNSEHDNKVKFFRYFGKDERGSYRIGAVRNGVIAGMGTCYNTCDYVILSANGVGTTTRKVRKNTILWKLIEDMKAGRLEVSNYN